MNKDTDIAEQVRHALLGHYIVCRFCGAKERTELPASEYLQPHLCEHHGLLIEDRHYATTIDAKSRTPSQLYEYFKWSLHNEQE